MFEQTTINDKLFGYYQKEQLRNLGVTDNTKIIILSCSATNGTKMVEINGKTHIIK